MGTIKAPNISIAFIEKAAETVERGDRGIVAVALKETKEIKPFNVFSVEDIPNTLLTQANQQQIRYALKGYNVAPKKVLVYVMKTGEDMASEYNKMLDFLLTEKWDYLAIPTVETDKKTSQVAEWIKAQREKKKYVKAVLPNTAADFEGIINVTSSLVKDGVTLKSEECCTRIAGLLAGTLQTYSCTYAPLPDFDDCSRFTDEDERVGNGEFIFTNDGEKVKVVRGVNSLTTTTDTKGDSFKKIKLVSAMDMIADTVRQTVQDSYIGKYPNTYDNKCLLIMAINDFFKRLSTEGVITEGAASIDIEAVREYWKEKAILVKLEDGSEKALTECSEDDIKRSNTGSKLFLKAEISLIDAIEDVDLLIYI